MGYTKACTSGESFIITFLTEIYTDTSRDADYSRLNFKGNTKKEVFPTRQPKEPFIQSIFSPFLKEKCDCVVFLWTKEDWKRGILWEKLYPFRCVPMDLRGNV